MKTIVLAAAASLAFAASSLVAAEPINPDDPNPFRQESQRRTDLENAISILANCAAVFGVVADFHRAEERPNTADLIAAHSDEWLLAASYILRLSEPLRAEEQTRLEDTVSRAYSIQEAHKKRLMAYFELAEIGLVSDELEYCTENREGFLDPVLEHIDK